MSAYATSNSSGHIYQGDKKVIYQGLIERVNIYAPNNCFCNLLNNKIPMYRHIVTIETQKKCENPMSEVYLKNKNRQSTIQTRLTNPKPKY